MKTRFEQIARSLRPAHLVGGLIGLVYLGLRLWHFKTVEQVAEFYDTLDYARIAFFPLADGRFWNGIKPPVIPLLLKLASCNLGVVAFWQLILSAGAWLALAETASQIVKAGWVRWAAFVAILAFSLNTDIVAWDTVILSESLALSLTALLIAGWFWLAGRWTWPRAALLCAIAVLWAFTRDVHAWLLLPLAALSALVGLLNRTQRRYLAITALLAVAFGVSFLSAGGGEGMDQRWVLPLVNVITRRVLTNPDQLAWFQAQGMPVTPELLRLGGNLGWENNWAPFDDYALQPFRDWLVAGGKAAYMRYLISHPGELLFGALGHLPDILVMRDLHLYASETFTPLLPPWLNGIVSLGQNATVLGWAALAALVAGGGMVVRSRFQPRWLIPWVVLALAYPHAAVVWHGDAAEVGRHSITVSMQLRLGLWMMIALGVDEIWAYLRRSRPRVVPAQEPDRRPGLLVWGAAALALLALLLTGWAAVERSVRRQSNAEMEILYCYVGRQPAGERVYIPRPTPLPGSLLFGLGNMPDGWVKSFCSTTGVVPAGLDGRGASYVIHPDDGGALAAVQRLVPAGLVEQIGAGLTVYRAANDTLAPQVVLRANWADRVELLGYDLPAQAFAPGETIPLTVYWRARERIDRQYTFFVHLVGEQTNPAAGGPLWGQHDAQPGQATYPTTFWSPGEIVLGEYNVPIAADAPPGSYRLLAGFYFLPTLERLPVFDPSGQPAADHIVLGTIDLE